ncbi:MAG: orotate phosphoribosyltransferase [Candidatus Dadabacteria bacterium]|nr:orotate phosphoribosyltransferase [Candidatus Dadabacteria bacterium]NIS07563.1 orotate phosphoribosyltransferase [Candidatus Dadabacteria bacterium]NIY21178.1 orotate phosphoribosyltransferase [Candidatus Dadabacteria bacterium]
MDTEKQRLKEILQEKSIMRGEFTLASGKKSDYYIDCRLTSLDAEGAYLVGKIILSEIIKNSEIVGIGGPTMGADPIVGSVIAQSHVIGKKLNGFLVRKEEKKHGTAKLIEGNLNKGDKVVVVEDVVTTAGSVIKAIKVVQEFGAVVETVYVIVDREEGGEEKFQELGITYNPIFKIHELL